MTLNVMIQFRISFELIKYGKEKQNPLTVLYADEWTDYQGFSYFLPRKNKGYRSHYSAPKIFTFTDISSESSSRVLPSVGIPSFWAVSSNISSFVLIGAVG
jgi:hypothetical protein